MTFFISGLLIFLIFSLRNVLIHLSGVINVPPKQTFSAVMNMTSVSQLETH